MRTTKRIILVLLGFFVLASVSIPVLVWLAFGPIHSSGVILISQNRSIEYKETYHGDFAEEFYDVEFIMNDSTIGFYTFHNMDWNKHVFIDSLSNKIFLFIADSSLEKRGINGYYLISFDSKFENVIDTVFNKTEEFNYQDEMKGIVKKH